MAKPTLEQLCRLEALARLPPEDTDVSEDPSGDPSSAMSRLS
jgi:hypothetical protein